jgi:hypothetical protein
VAGDLRSRLALSLRDSIFIVRFPAFGGCSWVRPLPSGGGLAPPVVDADAPWGLC